MKLVKKIALLSLLFLGACSSSVVEVDESSPVLDAGPSTPTQESLKPGHYTQTISSGGVERKYILYVPKGYDASQALPLVFVLHGGGGTAEGMVKLTGMNERANQRRFFVAYLQGLEGSDGKASWRTGLNPQFDINVDDAAFVRDLAKHLAGQLKVDSKRIYAAGFSAGGGMSHRLAAELPDLLASVAVVEGAIGTSLDQGATFLTIPEPKGPISVAIIHGLLDPMALYDGGQGGKYYYTSAAEAVALWTTVDGCTDTPVEQASADGNFTTKDYTACSDGTEVELFTVIHGKHEWPTLEGTGFSATDAILDFFFRHTLSNAEQVLP